MTTSVKGEDRLEEIARIIDPIVASAWLKVRDYEPPPGSFDEVLQPYWQEKWEAALAKARQIAALPAPCPHEPYQGRCIHCDVPFVNGRPAPDRESADEGALREAAQDVLDRWWEVPWRNGEPAAAIERLRKALSALSKDTEASAGEQQ